MTLVRTLLALRLRGRSRVGLVSLLVVMTLASAGVVTGLEVLTGTGARLDALYAETGRPDLIVNGGPDGVPAALEQAVADGAVEAVSSFDTVFAAFATPDGAEVGTTVVAIDGMPEVGGLVLRSGRLPNGADEIVIDAGAAVEHGFAVGSSISLGVGGTDQELTIVGTAVDLSRCFYPACTPLRGYVTADGLANIAPDGTYVRAHVRLATDEAGHGAASSQRAAVAESLMATGLVDGVTTWDDVRADLLLPGRVFAAFLAGFGVFVLVATLLMVASTAFGAVDARRRELGLLKAIGVTPAQLVAVTVLEHVLIGMVGAVIGWVLGSLVAPMLHLGLVDVLGRAAPTFALGRLAAIVVAVIVVLFVATIAPARRAGVDSARQLMGDAAQASPRYQRALRHLPLSAPSQLGAQLALARPIRAALAALALGAAVGAGLAGWRLSSAVESLIDEPALAGDGYDVLVGVPTQEHGFVDDRLASVDGVAGWYTEAGTVGTLAGVDVGVRAIGDDVEDAGLVVIDGRLPTAPGEALVGWGPVRDGRARIGDSIEVELDAATLTVDVVGRHGDLDHEGQVVVVAMDDLLAIEPDARMHWRVAGDGSVDRGVLAERIEDVFEGRALVQLAADATSQLRPFRIVLAVLVGLVGAVAAANLAATLIATSRERRRELGVVRSLGFSQRELRQQSATGGAVLGACGVLVGIPVGLLASRWIIDRAADEVGLGPGVLEPALIVPTLTAAGVGIAAAAVIGIGATRSLRAAHLPDLVREV